jgi:hypothetical protein
MGGGTPASRRGKYAPLAAERRRTFILGGVGHGIPPAQQSTEWSPFLRQHLRLE